MKKNIEIVRDYLDGIRPVIQTGYTGDINKFIIRKEGEKWADASGKKWIQTKNGPQTITRVLDIIREEAGLEKCTSCGCELRWRGRLDQKMYYKTKKCFDCVIEEETNLRLKGQFKLYESKKLIENELAYLEDVRQHLKDSKDYLDSHKQLTYVNGNGLVEEWDNVSRDELLENVKKDFVTCLKKIKAAQKELKKVNAEISKVLKPA
jgi:hypothetical protein